MRNMEDTDLPQLSINVVTHIMSYLSMPDKMAAGLVNRTWREAFLYGKFVNQQVLSFGSPHTDNLNELLNVLQNSTRLFKHFILREVELTNKLFWNQYGLDMESLVLRRCNLNETTLVYIINCCKNLKVLHIDACYDYSSPDTRSENEDDVDKFTVELVHLRELSLNHNDFLSDALFNKIIAICPNLDSLSLMGSRISFHNAIYKRFYVIHIDAHTSSESVFTFGNITQFLKRQASKLKHLNFGETDINTSAFTTMSTLEDLKLESLIIPGCYQLKKSDIEKLPRSHSCLKAFDISGMTNDILIYICKNLKELEVLKLRKCPTISDVGVRHTKLLRKLKHLDVSGSGELPFFGITHAFCCESFSDLDSSISEYDDASENVNPSSTKLFSSPVKYICNYNLEILCANNIASLDEQSIEGISLSFPNLKVLELSYCSKGVTDKTMQMILENLTRLQTLKISHCNEVTDAGLTGHVGIPIPSLLKGSHGFSLNRLRSLRELDISGCERITDASLKDAFAFRELRILNLSKCLRISEEGLDYLSQNNPAIEDLNLNFCDCISDTGISFVAKRMHRLKRLLIKGCSQLTDQSLESIKLYCHSLRYLDPRDCNEMSVRALINLMHLYREWVKDDIRHVLFDSPDYLQTVLNGGRK